LKHFEIASSRKFLKAAAFSAVMGEGGQEAGDKRQEARGKSPKRQEARGKSPYYALLRGPVECVRYLPVILPYEF
jgi:hypothetical protein